MTVHHYHGTPIWGQSGKVLRLAVTGAGAFVSFARMDQIKACFEHAEKIGFDNGAFSAWKRGIIIDWSKFYRKVEELYDNDKLEFFVIPDVIEGGETDNDDLISKLPAHLRGKAAPVWHLHESIERLVELCENWPRVCFGSSGEYAVIRTKQWHQRMMQAFGEIYIRRGLQTKIHGLRMLDGRIVGNYPLHTADSTNLACNVAKFNVKYPKLTQDVLDAGYGQDMVLPHRCVVMKGAIEAVKPPTPADWVMRHAAGF